MFQLVVPMKSLIGKRCLTAQERIDVLDARDRLLREGESNIVYSMSNDMVMLNRIRYFFPYDIGAYQSAIH